jgi:hypothetical protein
MVHSRELELASRDFIDSRKPDLDIAERVERYTNWDGELNEIIHYSKANVRGIDIIVNMVLSDFCGDTLDIETIFGPHYKYFGVRVFNHDLYDYCICIIYAEEIYSSLKSALFTSSNIDEELEMERSLLDKRVKENMDYRYTEHYARDHPNARFDVYESNTFKTKRKVRLTNFDDDNRTFTVLRRESLEREPSYKFNSDPDYQYSHKENERHSTVSSYDKPFKKQFDLGTGEFIVRQTVTDYDKEVYTKKNRNQQQSRPSDYMRADPRASVFKEEQSKLYYGDLNDVSRFEENVVDKYDRQPYIKHDRTTERVIMDRTPSSKNAVSSHYSSNPVDRDNALNGSFRDRPATGYNYTHQVEDFSPRSEISFRQERPVSSSNVYNASHRSTVADQGIRSSKRFSHISAIPQARETNARDTNVSLRQQLAGYRMEDKEVPMGSASRSNAKTDYTYKEAREVNTHAYASAEKIPFDIKDNSPMDRSTANRTTRLTGARKSRVNPAYRMDSDSELSW